MEILWKGTIPHNFGSPETIRKLCLSKKFPQRELVEIKVFYVLKVPYRTVAKLKILKSLCKSFELVKWVNPSNELIWLFEQFYLDFSRSFILVMISSCYRTVPSAIWEIFSKFLIFCNLFHEPLGEWNNSKIWETRKIFANIARGNVR